MWGSKPTLAIICPVRYAIPQNFCVRILRPAIMKAKYICLHAPTATVLFSVGHPKTMWVGNILTLWVLTSIACRCLMAKIWNHCASTRLPCVSNRLRWSDGEHYIPKATRWQPLPWVHFMERVVLPRTSRDTAQVRWELCSMCTTTSNSDSVWQSWQVSGVKI